LKNMCTPNST